MKINHLVVLLLLIPCISGCGIYSFSGINIDYTKVQTISIQNFYNESGGGPPNLSQQFSEELREYFQNNTNLELVPTGGDLQIEGVISGYRLTPVAPTATGTDQLPDRAALQRLTISLSATYINSSSEEFDFENKNFSFYEDFNPQETPFTSVENDLIDVIFEQLILDIFNATVANW